jgi:hypothetical protein
MFQVNLYTLLQKFNAQTEKEYKTYKENFMKRFEITELPPYLILYIKVCRHSEHLVHRHFDCLKEFRCSVMLAFT